MKQIKAISLICALLLPVLATGQTKVRGTVVDSLSGNPEVGAIIQFFEAGGSQAIAYSVTDSLGVFSRDFNAPGDYGMLLQNLGRKSVSMAFKVGGEKELDLGTIKVQDDAQTLEGASVQAMKTLVKLDVGKLTYKVEEDPDSKAGTVLDMLRKVPMVTVDAQDKITVNGSSNFKVYVDGKPNQMLSSNPSQILKVMPASAVKDIEVITNPGAKYDAEGVGGVLNLITGAAAGQGSAISDGVYGSVSAGATSQGSLSGSVYLNAKKDKLTVGLNTSLYRQHLDGVKVEDLQKNTLSGTGVSNSIGMDQRTPLLSTELSASYEIDSRNLLSGSFGLMGFNQHADGTSRIAMDGEGGYSYSSAILSKYRSNNVNGSLDFQHSAKDVPGRTFTLSYRYSGTPLDYDYTNRFSDFSGSIPTMADQKSEGDDNTQENTFQADFTTPLGQGHSLSSGLKYIRRHNSADDKLYLGSGTSWEYDKAGSMVYDHSSNIGAAYSEYTGTFGKVTLTTGLRYEYTWQKVEYGQGYGHDFDSHFGDFVPSATLQYSISPMQNVGLTFNRRIQRPGITYLNPYVDKTSLTYISYGNSDLTSARNDILSLVYNYFSPKWVVSLTGRYSHCGSGISEYRFYKDGILNQTYGNILREDNTGLTAFINWTASPKTRIFTNSGFGYGDYSSKELGQSNHGWNWNAMIGLQQTLPADIMLSANLVSSGKTWDLNGWNGGMSMAMVGLSRSFLGEKLRLTIQAVSNLDKGGMLIKSFSAGTGYETSRRIEVPIRQVGFGLTYTFGKQGFQVKKAGKTIKNDDVINNSNGQAPGSGAGQVGM